MANNYQDGSLIVFQSDPSDAARTTLCIRSHTLDIESIVHDVTGTCHGGTRARIGGVVDGRGTVLAVFDLDTMPWGNPPRIITNGIGVMFFGLSATTGIQFPYIISKTHYEAAVESAVMYSFDVQMNILAGSLVYGAAAA